jgi:UDP-N-acetylmuramoyl-L-alanyl-D-glutamate--2,6-diaminopimelate ligase
MKLLRDILYKVSIQDVIGPTNIAVENVCFDSRQVAKLSAFVAIKGSKSNGHDFIETAESLGAAVIVCEDLPTTINKKITYVRVEDTSVALGYIASNFFDNPSSEIKLVGITGTNGKTTTVTLLHGLYTHLGYKVGLISTVVNKIASIEITATHTTPDPIQLNALLRQMVNNGCTHCFMEVSSHAVAQNRISGLSFQGGVFTNITHDHLDYHITFCAYIKAKQSFFSQLDAGSFALVNKDDKHALVMLEHCPALKKTYGLKSFADFKCKIVESDFTGLQLNMNGHEVWSKLIGNFNASNLTACYATAMLLGEEQLDVLTALSSLAPVKGRFEYIKAASDVSGIVDYAHTPDALRNVLYSINEIRTGNEQLITVVGCGGDRDREKRPLMAEIACDKSTKVILTSDNPRSEEPEAILADMKKGIKAWQHKNVLVISNREEAIKTAVSLAQQKDIILIAGKGHEKYQEIKGERYPFDDLKILTTALKNK